VEYSEEHSLHPKPHKDLKEQPRELQGIMRAIIQVALAALSLRLSCLLPARVNGSYGTQDDPYSNNHP
jgi:hypothetical protein